VRRLLLVISLLSLMSSCRTDYDIGEVAPESFEGEACDHSHTGQAGPEDEHSEHRHSEEHEQGSDTEGLSGSEMHFHEPGQRNHGTAWFFNQPWAASFVWGKMLRDSVVLVVLALTVYLGSGYRRRRR